MDGLGGQWGGQVKNLAEERGSRGSTGTEIYATVVVGGGSSTVAEPYSTKRPKLFPFPTDDAAS